MSDFSDIIQIDGEDNTSGIAVKLAYCPMSWLHTLPEPPVKNSEDAGALEDLVTVASNIFMKEGKSMKIIDIELETGEIRNELQGETGGKSYKNMLEFLVIGNKAKALGFAQAVKNTKMFFLVEEQDGQVRMFGSERFPAIQEAGNGTTGKAGADRKSNTFTFYYINKGPAPIFTGKVMLTTSGQSAGSGGEQDIVFID